MQITYKSVDEYGTRGIIVTADTIMDLRKWLDTVDGSAAAKSGAKEVVDFLDNSYRKAFR